MRIPRLSFPLQMALGMFLGIFVGLFFGEKTSCLGAWAQAYIMIVKITALPYLIVAIIHGIGLLNESQAWQILKKGSFFISIVLIINISIIYLITWTLPASATGSPQGFVGREIPVLNIAKLLIPENVFYSMANNVVPSIVIFSLLVGIALMQLLDKHTVMSSLSTMLDALSKITYWISRITPLGTFLVMANQVGTVHFATITQISAYLILYILGLCTVIFWIMPHMACMLTPMHFTQWLRALIPILLLSYTTNLVIVSIPYIIHTVKQELQRIFPRDENVQTQIQGTVAIIFNLPLNSIFSVAFIFFVAKYYAIPLKLSEQIQLFFTSFLTGLGSVGLGSWINSINFNLNTLGLPKEAIKLYLTLAPFTSGFQAMTSVALISTLSWIITLAGRGLLSWSWKRVLARSFLIVAPVILTFSFIKFFIPFPKIENPNKSIYDLEIASHVSVLRSAKTHLPKEHPTHNSVLNKILQTKHLKVGFDPDLSPFCFSNRNGHLVGFDIAYAHQLAYDLGCESIEFVPLSHSHLDKELDQGVYDIVMAATTISKDLLRKVTFPNPYLKVKVVFVCSKEQKKKLSHLDLIRSDTNISLAAVKNTVYETVAQKEFPSHKIYQLDDFENFTHHADIDLLIWEEAEAIAWTAAHPEFQVLYPYPSLGLENLSYPIKMGEHEFLAYINSWLAVQESNGFKDQQYHLWILGETQEVIRLEKRWSIWDNVLRPWWTSSSIKKVLTPADPPIKESNSKERVEKPVVCYPLQTQ